VALVTVATFAVAAGCTLDYGRKDCEPEGSCGWWGEVDADPWQPIRDGGQLPVPDAYDDYDPYPDAGWIDPSDGGPIDPYPDAGWIDPSDSGPIDPYPDAGVPDFECASITIEAVCIVLPQCEAMYVGIDCECDDEGSCTCDSWEFAACE